MAQPKTSANTKIQISRRKVATAMIFGRRRSTAGAAALILYSRRYLSSGLNIAVITGTTRTGNGPPRPILGPRVANFVQHALEKRRASSSNSGDEDNSSSHHHTVTIVDPRSIDLKLLEKPHFAYASSQVPPVLDKLYQIFSAADAYVTITPEYNHAPSPALLNILNHFGSSTFSFKPSAIISYSAGQWGGTRAAHSLRPILSELGCIPVSAMIHIPCAQNVLDENGNVVVGGEEDEKRWNSYVDRCFSQLEWWGNAAKSHKKVVDPNKASPAFRLDPSQRNVPPSS